MKTLQHTLFVFGLILIQGSIVLAQKSTTEPFVLKGQVHSEIGKQLPSVIEVYDNNEKIDEVHLKRNGKFKLKLAADAHYTLNYYMPLHVTKKLIVSTQGAGETVTGKKGFEFDIFLYDQKTVPSQLKDVLDFPTAMLQYDERKESLVINEAYSSFMYGEIEQIQKDQNKILVAQSPSK